MTITNTPADHLEDSDQWLPDPRSCPSWCKGEHAQVLAEGNDIEDAQEHEGRSHEYVLPELRNYVDKRVTRLGGASWHMYPRVRPWNHLGGAVDQPTIRLSLEVLGIVDQPQAVDPIELTSGEARTLARHLLNLADVLDLGQS